MSEDEELKAFSDDNNTEAKLLLTSGVEEIPEPYNPVAVKPPWVLETIGLGMVLMLIIELAWCPPVETNVDFATWLTDWTPVEYRRAVLDEAANDAK